jgi:PAS domain S-box-containing protein
MAAKKKANKKPSIKARSDKTAATISESNEKLDAAAYQEVALNEFPEPPSSKAGPPVVCIGASAGGLDAIRRLFADIPADSGFGFVLIPRLDPTQESMMPELIARQTSMPVVEATDGMRVEANHVYIIPPDKHVTLADGTLLNTIGTQSDIHDGREADTAARENTELQRFLRQFTDSLQSLSDPGEVQATACRLLGEYLGVANANYASLETVGGVEYYVAKRSYASADRPSVDGLYRLADFPGVTECLQTDRTMVVNEVATDPRLKSEDRASLAANDIGMFMITPLVKGGRLTATFAVHGPQVRTWKDCEVKLLEAVAERTWAAVERARAEEALQASEVRLRLSQDAAKISTFDWDIVSDKTVWPPEMEQLWGLSEGGFEGTYEHWRKLVHPEALPKAEALVRKSMAQPGVPYDLEHRIVWPDGSVHWIFVRATTLWEAGKPIRMVGLNMVITERKESEMALRESEERLRSFLDCSAVIGWLKDEEGRYVFLSENYQRRFGVRLEDWKGKTDFEVWPREIAEVFRKNDLAVLASEQPQEVLEWTAEAAGNKSWWQNHKFTYVGPDGKRYVGGLGVDITKQQQAKSELKEFNARLEKEVADRTAEIYDRENRLRAILDNAFSAIISINRKGIVESFNRRAEMIFGYNADEIVGKNVKVLMPAPYREEHDSYISKYLETGEKHVIGVTREVVAQRKDGSLFPAELSVAEVDHQKIFIGLIQDITRRKALEREILEIASIEQRRIGQDLHDTLGQELTALNLRAVDLIESIESDPAAATKLAERVSEGLRRGQEELRKVMRGLLPVAVDVDGLMAALSELADQTLKEFKITCTFECPVPVIIENNLTATHLYLIAQEAVRNAVTHGHPQNIVIRLELDELVRLTVRDDGSGFEHANQPMANNRGLGLRIMRNRAAIIGATLTIEPARPKGTRILCALPRMDHAEKRNNQTS